ncbi:kinase-like domain-containing protein [Chlamydoabsidia padenii]|nr:kinase-like domain-containing protein [Chlamydoabsidia padenii]
MTKDSETILAPSTYDSVRHQTEERAYDASSLHGQQRQRSSSGNGVELNRTTTTTQGKNITGDSAMNFYATKSIDDYDLGGIIGYGSSAVVYGAFDTVQNIHVAIKMIDLDLFERNQIDELRRETALMVLSKHENILSVYSSFVTGSKLCIVTPYLGGGSCLDIMKTAFPDGLDEISIATILKQALEGIGYLHKNGHIHRDVKAGNLLVDDDGSVLLGDFGVSSSLMDTGERGLRKTFVGTPCWMAPEVMEQAGYDYKADIWSFGVTAIELATGQAPFAKLPPLKVLLMTLSNDPPTLVRETAKHKYSKIFKDMVDLCLCKDPANRPTAERLLQHPFFKQARKKDYLIKSILLDLPPLERRPRKGINRRQLSYTTSEEWDFNDDNSDYNNSSNMDNNFGDSIHPSAEQSNNDRNINTSKTSNNKNSHSNGKPRSFTDQSDHLPSKDFADLPKPKRHISFGHVVVRNPPAPSTALSASQPTCSSISDENPPISQEPPISSPNFNGARSDVKKPNSNPPTGVTRYPIYDQNSECHTRNIRDNSEPICMTKSSNNDGAYPTFRLTKSASSDSADDRRSRFEIHHGQEPITAPFSSSTNGLQPPGTASTTTSSHNNTLMSSNSVSIPATSDILSPSAFVSSSKCHTTDQGDLTPYEPTKKVGRFELTSTVPSSDTVLSDPSSAIRTSLDNHQLSATSLPSPTITLPCVNNDIHPISIASATGQCYQPHHYNSNTSLSITPPHSSAPLGGGGSKPSTDYLKYQMKELIKSNDVQRHLIEEMMGALHRQRSTASSYHRPNSTSSSSSSSINGDDLVSIIESLEKQLCRIGNENSVLRMENRLLRKELELERMI